MGRSLRVLCVALAAALGVACDSGDERAPLPPAQAAELATFVVDVFENDPAAASALMSHGPLVCVAEPFGADPAIVYAALFCVVREAGVAFDDSSGVSTVVAVHRASPVRVELPGDGAAHQPDIERIFPEDLRERAFEGYRDPRAAERELAARFAAQNR
ncbi:hypothetical protein Ais01nite_48020 [Asanoa ishikariensis]|uniref:Lipoprotein n=1 Tax=Asanoa ishikariensis TaxID=137265 RepID=A0A1H3RVQ5_9ACTN|nr:hypothetical protein [Asanoa ishikariensis]GIF66767.1 hypothetical protein Ais01nite_48020 [Asanoa ishikariensis]SDZ29803.1 hypothetical protein SAMN05421684_4279 [Asanoa ishikariensis]